MNAADRSATREATLAGLFDQLGAFRRPPVETWRPDKVIDFDLVIESDGRWLHEGDPITRRKLVKLFSTVLVRDADGFSLVTPHVRYRIRVVDTPFLAVEMTRQVEDGVSCTWFRTDVDEVVRLDADHPLDARVDPSTGEPSPVIHVRDGLEARLLRPVYYQLAEQAIEETPGSGVYGVLSAGDFFPLV